MTTRTAHAPGRVNLIGDHTDYNGGLCLPFAIPLGTTATVRPRSDDRVKIQSTRFGENWSGSLDEITLSGRETMPAWVRFVTGVLWAAREEAWPVPGMDIAIDSTLPLGAGLASSAAVTCAVALSVAAMCDRGLDPGSRVRLAALCCRAETEYVGAPTGGMDQLVVLLAKPAHGLLIDFANAAKEANGLDFAALTLRQVALPFRDAGLTVLVTDTRSRHELADPASGYARRREECTAAAATLGLPRLGLAWPDDLTRLADETQRARARHVLSESSRVEETVGAVAAGDWSRVGALLSASHASLRGDFAVSNPSLDLAVDTAMDAGALGARLTGGGFGGCTIALVRLETADVVQAAIDRSFRAAQLPAPAHFRVSPAPGASTYRLS